MRLLQPPGPLLKSASISAKQVAESLDDAAAFNGTDESVPLLQGLPCQCEEEFSPACEACTLRSLLFQGSGIVELFRSL
jgi:hypothetical protein